MRFVILFLLFYTPIFSQNNYPKDYFRLPLDVPMQLSGNFGELRPNHFHAGLDFKTLQKEGLNVYAVADGYVSRIKISTYGYGKAIYITHPNGFTSVYGHLQKANSFIENYLNKEQYKQELYEIELFPLPNELIVKKGDIIAVSGNTGGSEGPHLHFEIRDSLLDKSINPLLFGFDKFLKDTKKPSLSNLIVYPINQNSITNQSKRPVVLSLTLQKDGTYLSEKVFAFGKIGFGVTTTDTDDVSFNNNGIFKIQSFLNGVSNFSYQFDILDFDESKCINALIDFPRYKKTKQRVQKLFMKNSYPLSNIKTNQTNGILNIDSNFSETYRIEILDFFNNKTTVLIPIEFSSQSTIVAEEPKKSNYFIKSNTESNFEKENKSVFFQENTFYDDFYLNFDATKTTLTVHDESVPVSKNFQVIFEDSLAAKNNKTFIASVEENKLTYNNTKIKGNTLTTHTKNLGQFILAKDTIAPKILLSKTKNEKLIELRISDDLSGIKSYNGYINGKWAIFEYDFKTKKLVHFFDNKSSLEGKNQLKVVVIDNLGNSAIFETTFYKSQKK